jgi:hypothetical protein
MSCLVDGGCTEAIDPKSKAEEDLNKRASVVGSGDARGRNV